MHVFSFMDSRKAALNLKITETLMARVLFFFNYLFIYFYRGEEGEKEREGNINVWLPLSCPLLGTWPTIQASTLTGNRTGDPLVCRPARSSLSNTSQGDGKSFNVFQLITYT